MGSCWKCNAQVTLQENQVNCDSCSSLIRYWCNSCTEPFDVLDSKEMKRLRECNICGFFVCPNCSVCYDGCEKYDWQKDILRILSEDIPIGKYPSLPNKVWQIVQYIENIKSSRERKTCHNGVPISYSKSRIKQLWAKVEGFKVKNIKDREEFLKRIDDATNLPLGTEITIENIREDGNYGQEYRDALNFLVCLGKFQIKWLKNKEDKDYCVFKRINNLKCPYLLNESVIINFCPKCKTINKDKDKKNCDRCIWSKGKNKDQSVELKRRLNNQDTCQLNRGKFNKGNGKT